MTIVISDIMICCNPIKPGCSFQVAFNAVSSGLLKDVYVLINDTLQISDQFSDDNLHCYCLKAPSTVSDYTITIQAVDPQMPAVSDIQQQILYVRSPTCPPYLINCNGLPFVPDSAGGVLITTNLSDVLDRIFTQHQLISCRNCCCTSFMLDLQSNFESLLTFIGRSDFAEGSQERLLQELISTCW